MIKGLTYFNLIYGMIYFFQVVNTVGEVGTAERFNAIGLILTTWYNWETLKIIKGQKKQLSKFSVVIGIITVLFAGLLIADSVLRVIKVLDLNDMVGGLLFLIGLEFIYATTIMIQAIWTIKKYLRPESTTANKMHMP